MTAVNGDSITYDAAGNPTSYRGHTLTWTMGRQLASYDTITYTYNEDGIRTSKKSGKAATRFYLDGSNVIGQSNGLESLYFRYDANGEVIGFVYNKNDYFYVKNQMKDIVGIVNAAGKLVVTYAYDPWGKPTVTDGNSFLARLNPFRYRSYYYDTETGLYYLRSRYYDPEICRFINADEVEYLPYGVNIFEYCKNSPINKVDSEGTMSKNLLNYMAKKYKTDRFFSFFVYFIVIAFLNGGNLYTSFHETAQVLVYNEMIGYYVSLEEPCKKNKKKEVDIFVQAYKNVFLYRIWEVKPKGGTYERDADNQLREYISLIPFSMRGYRKKTIEQKIFDKLKMKIEFNNRGGVFYSFWGKNSKRITNAEMKRIVVELQALISIIVGIEFLILLIVGIILFSQGAPADEAFEECFAILMNYENQIEQWAEEILRAA